MKKLFVLVIALLLCLTACGGSSDTAGDDWRTSGIVLADGTITHDEESVDVLVTISDTSAAFYRDTAEQVLFDSVLFPESIPDAKQAFESISFDDINGDGESDVVARFKFNDGGGEELVWIWESRPALHIQRRAVHCHACRGRDRAILRRKRAAQKWRGGEGQI